MEYFILAIIFLTFIIINRKIMTTQKELVDGLNALTSQLTKVAGEVQSTLDKVAALETALANAGTLSPEVVTAFEALKTQVDVVDSLTPDVV